MSRRPEPGAPDAAGDSDARPFLDHLEELRRTLLHCLFVVAAAVALMLPLVPRLLAMLTRPLGRVVEDPQRFLRSLQVAGAFSVTLRIAAWSGLLLSVPVLVILVARFVFPGLTRREKEVVTRSGVFAAALFAAGVALAYFHVLPLTLRLMLGLHTWLSVAAEWTVTDYVAFAVQTLIGFGLAFELPVLVLILGRLGLVTPAQFRRQRRFVIIGCLVLGMLMTPPDVASQLLLAAPLYLLFELCVGILWLENRRARTPQADPR